VRALGHEFAWAEGFKMKQLPKPAYLRLIEATGEVPDDENLLVTEGCPHCPLCGGQSSEV
jgi:hypothetical protein